MNPPEPHAAGAKRAERTTPRRAVVGVVLAGGTGSRLGQTKATLRLPGRRSGALGETLVEWAAARLETVSGVEEILVAAGEAGVEALTFAQDLPDSVIADGPGSGPAAGLLGDRNELGGAVRHLDGHR